MEEVSRAARRPRSAPPARDTLYVCRTCPREGWRSTTAVGEGERLAQALRAALASSPLAGGFDLFVVQCLGGCPKPCNVALVGAGKPYLRFNRLACGDFAAVLDLAARFRASADGAPAEDPSHSVGSRLALKLPAGIVGG